MFPFYRTNMKRLIKEMTADGSATLYIPEIDEHYHSIKGALEEARHVYIETALHQSNSCPVRILEIGFGTGLNAFLTLLDTIKRQIPVIYTTLELFPLVWDEIEPLQYPETIAPEYNRLFRQLHETEWNKTTAITPGFTLLKIQTDLTQHTFKKQYDVVYFDAFAPEKQPELWEEAIFSKIAATMSPGGILSTYCAKGEVRRHLQRSGFIVERLSGPLNGKREILRGRIA